MGCRVVKYILFFGNLVFALSGLALLAIGAAIQLQITAVTDLIDGAYEFGPIATMVVGAVVFLIAFFGCCGAIRESNCMLATYSIFMIMLMILEIALAVVVFVNADSLATSVKSEFDRVFFTSIEQFHQIETALQCCGPEGALSYGWYISTLPASCCAQGATCNVTNAYPGCNQVAADFISNFSTAIGTVCIVVAALEVVAVVFTQCLAKYLRDGRRKSRN